MPRLITRHVRHATFCPRLFQVIPRNLANADSKAVTPISPEAQKFRLLMLRKALDNSAALSNSFIPGVTVGRRHIAAENQNSAEPHAMIITTVSMYDRITTPNFTLDYWRIGAVRFSTAPCARIR